MEDYTDLVEAGLVLSESADKPPAIPRGARYPKGRAALQDEGIQRKGCSVRGGSWECRHVLAAFQRGHSPACSAPCPDLGRRHPNVNISRSTMPKVAGKPCHPPPCRGTC